MKKPIKMTRSKNQPRICKHALFLSVLAVCGLGGFGFATVIATPSYAQTADTVDQIQAAPDESTVPDTKNEDSWKNPPQRKTTWYDYPEVELRALDKITAKATTFKTRVGETTRFGDIYMKVQACRKPPAIEKSESAAFVQVWEQEVETGESRWVFSGWMFASNPALSAMDHPIYDVWAIQCLGPDPEPVTQSEDDEQAASPSDAVQTGDDDVNAPEAAGSSPAGENNVMEDGESSLSQDPSSSQEGPAAGMDEDTQNRTNQLLDSLTP